MQNTKFIDHHFYKEVFQLTCNLYDYYPHLFGHSVNSMQKKLSKILIDGKEIAIGENFIDKFLRFTKNEFSQENHTKDEIVENIYTEYSDINLEKFMACYRELNNNFILFLGDGEFENYKKKEVDPHEGKDTKTSNDPIEQVMADITKKKSLSELFEKYSKISRKINVTKKSETFEEALNLKVCLALRKLILEMSGRMRRDSGHENEFIQVSNDSFIIQFILIKVSESLAYWSEKTKNYTENEFLDTLTKEPWISVYP